MEIPKPNISKINPDPKNLNIRSQNFDNLSGSAGSRLGTPYYNETQCTVLVIDTELGWQESYDTEINNSLILYPASVEFPDEKSGSNSAKRKDVKTTTKLKGKGAEKSKHSKKKR